MSLPLVSLCIPNYNNERYLDVCIRSALSQTWPHVEVVLVDDCSTDGSFSLARKYEERIRLFRNEKNLGQPANTNRCVELARGEFVAIVHGDDYLLPIFVERLAPLLQQYERAALAIGERYETDETGVLRNMTPFYTTDCLIPGEKQAKVFMFMSFPPCQVLIRRAVYRSIGGADLRHVVNLDGLLWFKCALAGDIVYVREPVGVYRKHGESTTARYNRRIDHMIEYYMTLLAMQEAGRGRPYLERYYDAAVKRVGELTVRYCREVFREKNYELAKRYLALATAFDPAISKSNQWRALHYCLESEDRDPHDLYQRLMEGETQQRITSYEPPEGFQALKSQQAGGASS
ncbi:MAG: glycosyltransferase [Nitrospira sp.]|nr:glycosyltransferase [Nitrospira sp.]MCP9463762.1 glycosyltransferase [Nitrospira sp.]